MSTIAIGQLVRSLRQEKKWTLADLASSTEMTIATLSKKERGDLAISPLDRKAFAAAFGLTLEDFDSRWRAWRIERSRGAPGIPVINRAPAGQIVDYEECGPDSGQGYEYLDFGQVDDDLAFAIIVVGDSMAPTIVEGDYVVFSPTGIPRPRVQLESGKVVFIRFGPDSSRPGCTIGRFQDLGGGKYLITKDNPKHKPIACDREELVQIAVAIERRSQRF